TSLAIPSGLETEWSVSSSVIHVGVSSRSESPSHTESGMRFILAPRSANHDQGYRSAAARKKVNKELGKDRCDDERTESDEDKNPNLNQNDDDKEEEYVRTPENFESTDDENEHVDEEEYDRIDEEFYKDVNVELKDAEHGEQGKGDAEMTDDGHDNVTQETTYDAVEDDAHVTLAAAHVT
nr:hypothetical protein [Tanacetum cinerariifolium]